MPGWFQYEGVDAVLDRLAALGVTAIATSPCLFEIVPDGTGEREPPADGEAGRVRLLDRPLAGRTELWVKPVPAFEHDPARYRGLRYQPPAPTPLTVEKSRLLDRVIAGARARDMAVYLQIMAASPPGYRAGFSALHDDDLCRGPDGLSHRTRVGRHGSLASEHLRAYLIAFVTELAERYPVTGFRLDLPEVPPCDFASALCDFHPAMRRLLREAGHDDVEQARATEAWSTNLARAVRASADGGPAAVVSAMQQADWAALTAPQGFFTPLRDARRQAIGELLLSVRGGLDALPGPHRRLEPQVFPPPFHAISGFPLDETEGLADRIGIKLYTMHWPMLARHWAQGLLGPAAEPARVDTVTAALAGLFDLVDSPAIDGRQLHYPGPDTPHPVGAGAQRRKLRAARVAAGNTPVVAFAHGYGPVDDVVNRFRIACEEVPDVWLNRYGYLSERKLDALGRTLAEVRAGTAGGVCP